MSESKDLALSILCQWRAAECKPVRKEKISHTNTISQKIKQMIKQFERGESI